MPPSSGTIRHSGVYETTRRRIQQDTNAVERSNIAQCNLLAKELQWKGFFRYKQVPFNEGTLLEVKLKILGNAKIFW